jgi:ribosomal protein S18 acetylase RimI-like enzyme
LEKTRAQQQLLTNWVAIILAVLSIIQGLAFNNLVVQFPDIYKYSRTGGDIRVLIHFFLSFILLLRIFQTYVTAALDYNPWLPNSFDVLIIFVIGALEYFLFSTLNPPSAFNVAQYHSRLMLISVLGIFGYLGAMIRIKEDLFPGYKVFAREVRLQIVNIIGVAIVLAISALIVVFPTMRFGIQTVLVSIAMATLIFSVLFSIRITFSARDEEVIPVSARSVPAPTVPAKEYKKEVFFKTVEREDVAEFNRLFVETFGYYYSAIFDTSPRLTQRLVKIILLVNRGKHPLGYQAFHIACEEGTGRILGFLMVTSKESQGLSKRIIGVGSSMIIVLWQLGIVGLIRTIGNLRRMGMFEPPPERDELEVIYFAVGADSRRHGVGRQMMMFIENKARNLKKQSISLEVREKNNTARRFFESLGFSEECIISSDGDVLLNQGHRIRMSAQVVE